MELACSIVYIPRTEIAQARLFRHTRGRFKTWVPGGLSTITHVILIPMTGAE